MYDEEGNWFLNLKKNLAVADQTKLTFRYKEQFARYAREDAGDMAPRLDDLASATRETFVGRRP